LDDFFRPLVLSKAQARDAVICTSRAARTAFLNLLGLAEEGLKESGVKEPIGYGGQLPVIPLGVDTTLYRPRDKSDVRYQLHLPQDAFVMLWVGRLSPRSKADLNPLVHAHAVVRQRNPTARIMLVVVGTDRENHSYELLELAAALGTTPDVRIERTTPTSPIQLWYSAADVFVSPVDNVQETFGLTNLEAMASGLPQVVSDWNGYRETVVHGSTGFLIPTFWGDCDDEAIAAWQLWGDAPESERLLARTVAISVGDLCRFIETLLLEKDLRTEMGLASRARAESQFTWRRVIGLYEECWHELIETEAGDPTQLPSGGTPAFYSTFGHYASRTLDADSLVRISTLGTRRPLISPNGTFGRTVEVESRILAQIVAALEQQDEPMTLGAIASTLVTNDCSSQQIIRGVLNGIKLNALEITGRVRDAMSRVE
jgi:glycosyltransferase involved in cell wall biosynthesis